MKPFPSCACAPSAVVSVSAYNYIVIAIVKTLTVGVFIVDTVRDVLDNRCALVMDLLGTISNDAKGAELDIVSILIIVS